MNQNLNRILDNCQIPRLRELERDLIRHNLPLGYKPPNYRDFAQLKNDIDHLASLAKEGKFDPEKAKAIKKVIDFLLNEIDKNNLFYFEDELNYANDKLFFAERKVCFNLTEIETENLSLIKDRFDLIFERTIKSETLSPRIADSERGQ